MKLGEIVILNILLKPVDLGFKMSRVRIRIRVWVTMKYSGTNLHLHRVHVLVMSLLSIAFNYAVLCV